MDSDELYRRANSPEGYAAYLGLPPDPPKSARDEAVEWFDGLLWLTANTAPNKAARVIMSQEMITRMQTIRDGLVSEGARRPDWGSEHAEDVDTHLDSPSDRSPEADH